MLELVDSVGELQLEEEHGVFEHFDARDVFLFTEERTLCFVGSDFHDVRVGFERAQHRNALSVDTVDDLAGLVHLRDVEHVVEVQVEAELCGVLARHFFCLAHSPTKLFFDASLPLGEVLVQP